MNPARYKDSVSDPGLFLFASSRIFQALLNQHIVTDATQTSIQIVSELVVPGGLVE
jgi:hypothetical protein